MAKKVELSIKNKLIVVATVFAVIVVGAVIGKNVTNAAVDAAAKEAAMTEEQRLAQLESEEESSAYSELGYNQDQQDVSEILRTGYWVDENNMRYEFSFTEWKVFDAGEEKSSGTYRIGVVETSDDYSKQSGNNNVKISFVMEDPTGNNSALATLTQTQSDKGIDMPWELSCKALSERLLTNNVEIADVEMVDFEGEIVRLLGGDGAADKVSEYMCDFTQRTFPTATKLTFSGQARLDSAKHTVEMSFVVDNRAKTTLKAIYNTESGSVNIY